MLSNNIFYKHNLPKLIKAAVNKKSSATVFAYHVNNPKRYSVVKFNNNSTAISLKKKPLKPKSNYAVTKLYFYNNNVVKIAKNLKPSAQSKLKITNINRIYIKQKRLSVAIIKRSYA